MRPVGKAYWQLQPWLGFCSHSQIPATSVCQIVFMKTHASFPEKLTEYHKHCYTVSCTVKESEKIFPDPSLYQDQHQNLMGSILGRHPSSVQVLWKSVQEFSCHPADKPTNQPTNIHRVKNITSLAKIIKRRAVGIEMTDFHGSFQVWASVG